MNVFIVLVALLAMAACGSDNEPAGNNQNNPPAANTGNEAAPVPTQTPAPTATPEPEATPRPMPLIGDNIFFGGYEWNVLEVQNEYALVIKNIVMTLPAEPYNFSEFATWDISTVHA
jgi:hypothetical protein